MLQNFNEFRKVNEASAKMKRAEINQKLKEVKNPKELRELFKDMYNNGNELNFMDLYINCNDDKLDKLFFDVIKNRLERFTDGLV